VSEKPETATEPLDAEKPKKSRPRWQRYALDALLIVGVYVAVTAWREHGMLASHTRAPSFTLRSLDGTTVSLSDLHGKRVLLHFWATWCGVCRQEHGTLSAVAHGLGRNEALYAIVADSDDPDAVRRYVADHHIDYPVLLGDERVISAYRVGAFPTNYFIEPDGAISGRTVGMTTRWGLRLRLAWAR
jgi:peroxiredoxin